MKDKNGIEIDCENCRHYEYCDDKFYPDVANGGEGCNFEASAKALEVRIAELQEVIKLDLKSVNIDDINGTLTEAYEGKIKELEEDFCTTTALLGEIAQERDKLREKVKELEAHNEVLQRRVQEFSMEILDYNMKENKDVLERIKEYEENFDKNTSTQSTEDKEK